MDPSSILNGWLFALFAVLTAALSAVIEPTYDYLLVPLLQPAALFPSLGASGGSGFLATAASMSTFVLGSLVDPAIALVAVGIGLLYVVRASFGPIAKLANLLPRFVFGVVLANFSLPVAGALFGLAGATYPVLASFDGGAWETWTNLGGIGFLQFSWDNGALAFVLAFVLFSLILLLVLLVAVRNAMLGVLLVLLPIFTILWPIPTLAPLARRAWLWFGELAFLPCVMIIPLELAVGCPSNVLLVGYLVVALGSPALLALAAGNLTAAGMPSAGGALVGGVQRGLSALSVGATAWARPISAALPAGAAAGRLAKGVGEALERPFPGAIPAAAGAVLGHGVDHLLRHVAPRPPSKGGSSPSNDGSPFGHFRGMRGG
ncbi:MAG: hypothetical protein L3K03_03145 [Thermoplasmata archaeon]|nr:hypothetical protein [Thermoplasmata archaeon]